MTWRRLGLLPILMALWACAEGGIRGSGISTNVAGNVVSIQPAGRAPGSSDLSGIVVAVEGTDIADRTDEEGVFSLRGTFDGRVTVVFTLPDDGGQARIDLNVPAGGTLTLSNVDVDAQQGEAAAETATVDFTGIVTAVDCPAELLVLKSSPSVSDDVDQYIVQLDTSTLEDARGMPLPCTAVRAGQHASVQGTANRDGTFGEATIVLQN